MIKGQIFWAKDSKKHPHPIVFLKSENEETFVACILSTKNSNGNILLKTTHFEVFNEYGIEYNFKYKNSHLVHTKVFVKEVSWLNSIEPQGMLTKDGIQFIESHLDGLQPEYLPISIKALTKLV